MVHCGLDPHLIHVLLVWILLIDTHDARLPYGYAHKNTIKGINVVNVNKMSTESLRIKDFEDLLFD